MATCGGALGARGVQVFVEPDAGEVPILRAIEGANRSIWVEVYLLTDRNVIRALEDAAGRGIDVRVLLEAHPYGGGDVAAQQTLESLNAANVQARWSNPVFTYTHAKTVLVDSATAYILTSNLSKSGLGGSSVAANREYGVMDTLTNDVSQVKAIFLADWDRTAVAVTSSYLVISPENARAKLAALMAGAQSTLQLEDEEMYDSASEETLITAAKRGVNVEVVLPTPSGSGSDTSGADRLKAGGVHVRYLTAPYLHAKLIVADGALAFVGSENFSATSLDKNREVGVLIADTAVLGTLSHTFTLDWSAAADA